MKYGYLLLIFLALILSVAAVSASDNVTGDADQMDLGCNDDNQSVLCDVVEDDGNQTVSSDVAKDKIVSKDSVKQSPKKAKKKVTAKIETKNFNTYYKSDLYFKAKIINKATKKPIKGVKVLFKVYSSKNKHHDYYAKTNSKGVAELKKNLKVGKYTVYTYVKDKNVVAKKSKSTVKIKKTAEVGCCSFYVQVNSTDSFAGFRRDSTSAAKLFIKATKWNGRTAVKQYKTSGSYFFHLIVTSDGWMVGTGGADSAKINKAIEKLAGKMVSSGKIKMASLKKIRGYERTLGIGHFAIKAPNGKYAVVWKNTIKTGKLKNGKYISVPNSASFFRQGSYKKLDKNPRKATLKVGATDSFGVNRRDITVYHWNKVNKNYKATSSVKVYAANDNGAMVGRYTAGLKDNIQFKNKFIGKNSLPYAPKMKSIGTHKFGNIDKLIKTKTVVKAPAVSNAFNKTKYFKVTLKDKKTKKALSNVKFKIKLTFNKTSKTYTLKTDKNGVVKFDTKKLDVGTYNVVISTANNKYLISGKSKIEIK